MRKLAPLTVIGTSSLLLAEKPAFVVSEELQEINVNKRNDLTRRSIIKTFVKICYHYRYLYVFGRICQDFLVV